MFIHFLERDSMNHCLLFVYAKKRWIQEKSFNKNAYKQKERERERERERTNRYVASEGVTVLLVDGTCDGEVGLWAWWIVCGEWAGLRRRKESG